MLSEAFMRIEDWDNTMVKYILRECIRKLYFLTFRRLMPRSFVYQRGKSGYSAEMIDRIKGLEKQIIETYQCSNNPEILETVKYIKRYGITGIFPYNFPSSYIGRYISKIKYDSENGLYYAVRNNHRIYMSRQFKTKQAAIGYYRSILLQEDDKSPHKYIERGKTISGEWLIEGGGAEGFFALDHIDDFERIIILEPDEDWLEALENTFAPWKSKVSIIPKCLSDMDTDTSITLDTIREEFKIAYHQRVSFKMDIEGAEMKALHGMKLWLENAVDIKGFICVYHYQDDEKNIRNFLEDIGGFKMQVTRGFMTNIYDENQHSGWLRRGVLRIEKTTNR